MPSNASLLTLPNQDRPRPSLNPLQLDSTDGVALPTGLAPRLKHGIVAAFGAQAHLNQKTKSIGDLFSRYGIHGDNWVGEVGFRLDHSKDGRGVKLPPILRQEIVITIVGNHGSAKDNLTEIVNVLKKLVTPYYGAIQFRGSKEDLGSQREGEAETSASANLFVEKFSRVYESELEVDLPDPGEAEKAPVVTVSVTNFKDGKNPEDHFTTFLRFEVSKCLSAFTGGELTYRHSTASWARTRRLGKDPTPRRSPSPNSHSKVPFRFPCKAHAFKSRWTSLAVSRMLPLESVLR